MDPLLAQGSVDIGPRFDPVSFRGMTFFVAGNLVTHDPRLFHRIRSQPPDPE
ncbi:hypothetical protein [Prescottella agglutinans]|uniref:hypothetical protein n=1 Tax=Prescottella agglutinans TaxID=1644129 RepID=UPI003D962622